MISQIKCVYTYDVIAMLHVSRRAMDNYIKAGKLRPTRIQKRNYFAIKQAKGLMYFTDSPNTRSYQEDVRSILQRV